MNPLTDLVVWLNLGDLFVSSAMVLLATDLDFWHYLGNILAAAAIGFIAIKSGYYEKRLKDKTNELERLCAESRLIDVVVKDIDEAEDIILNNKYHKYGYDQSEVDKLDGDARRSFNQKIEGDPKYHDIIFDMVSITLIPKYIDDYDVEKSENTKRAWENLNDKLRILEDIKKHGRDDVRTKRMDAIYRAMEECRVREKDNENFDKHFSDSRILHLFILGIAIQLISLLCSIDVINSLFSSTIKIVIIGIRLILDETIHVFEEILKIVWK